MSDSSNIELTLKHFIDHFDKTNDAMNIRLDKISTSFDSRLDQITYSVNELTGQKIIINQLDKRINKLEEYERINHLEEYVRLSHERIMILEHDAKRRDEISKAITTPILQKAIWAAICCVFVLIAGYGIKGVQFKSSEQMYRMMNK